MAGARLRRHNGCLSRPGEFVLIHPSDTGSTITPTRGQLFTGFFKTGLSGFGGVLPHARRMLVDDRRWLTDPQFTELLSLGQTLPGPNVLNMAVVIGARFHGWRGSMIAAFGLMTAPLVIVLSLAGLDRRLPSPVRLSRRVAAAPRPNT